MTEPPSEQPAEQPVQPAPDQLEGQRIGRYSVRKRLGVGGFARVYCAWDPDLEIDVALKIPKPQLADDVEALERFRREATTAARLRHPNVVTVLTVGRLEEPFDGAPTGTPYLVMDYIGGITLEEVGAILNLTRERIRQVEVRGLYKIKDHTNGELGIPPERNS